MDAEQLLSEATDLYLDSKDFSGYPCHHIRSTTGMTAEELRPILADLVSREAIALVFGDRHPNPHIRAFSDESVTQQLDKLEGSELEHTCLYPTSKHLSEVVDRGEYQDRPYTLELALGAGQLEFRVFELAVLEAYRNDPRYSYQNDDISGQICISDEYYLSPDVPERDKVLLETFGFAYDDDLNRAVAVFCIYLNRMSPEHQQIWRSKELVGSYKLHPDYFRNSILGDWGEKMSIFNAFLEELRIINRMCDLMGRPHLFRNEFKDNRPRNFSFLVRPTLNEYNDFALTLDKMMSDNINKKFFMGEVSDEVEEKRDDGKILVRQRGTIAMLEEWITTYIRPTDPNPMTKLIDAFKAVRKKRQKPAHSLKPDSFDQKYIHEQRQLVIDAYGAIRTIRLVLANHPKVRVADDLGIPDVLYQGLIWTY
jgi:hypothetical protein